MTEPLATPPSPEQAAAQLAIHRYAVTAADPETHTRLALEAPWANWVTQLPGPDVTWLVTVFRVDNDAFLTTVGSADGVTVQTIEMLEDEAAMVFKHQEPGWRPWEASFPAQSTNGHGHG